MRSLVLLVSPSSSLGQRSLSGFVQYRQDVRFSGGETP